MDAYGMAAVVALCVATPVTGALLLAWRVQKEVDRVRLKLEHRERQLAQRAFGDRKTTAISWPFPPPLPPDEH